MQDILYDWLSLAGQHLRAGNATEYEMCIHHIARMIRMYDVTTKGARKHVER